MAVITFGRRDSYGNRGPSLTVTKDNQDRYATFRSPRDHASALAIAAISVGARRCLLALSPVLSVAWRSSSRRANGVRIVRQLFAAVSVCAGRAAKRGAPAAAGLQQPRIAAVPIVALRTALAQLSGPDLLVRLDRLENQNPSSSPASSSSCNIATSSSRLSSAAMQARRVCRGKLAAPFLTARSAKRAGAVVAGGRGDARPARRRFDPSQSRTRRPRRRRSARSTAPAQPPTVADAAATGWWARQSAAGAAAALSECRRPACYAAAVAIAARRVRPCVWLRAAQGLRARRGWLSQLS